MASYVETPTRSDTAAGAIAQFLRVKTPGAIAVAGATDVSIGTMEFPCLAAGPCTVRLRSAQGTRKMVASEAITAGNTAYAAASGKIAATGTVVEGVAMETATADGDVIEVMDVPHVDLVAAGGITLPTVTFNGATAVNKLIMPDNLADALNVVEGSNSYVKFTTTNGSEAITVAKNATFTGNVTLSGAVDLIFSGTTGQPEISVVTNLADALSVKDSAGDLIVITTTTGSQRITITPPVTVTGAITATAGIVSTVASVTADGSNQGDAVALTAGAMNVVADGDDAKGVILPTAATTAAMIMVLNSGTAGLKIYPASNDKINNGSANAAITILENTMAILVPTAADNWAAVYTANS